MGKWSAGAVAVLGLALVPANAAAETEWFDYEGDSGIDVELIDGEPPRFDLALELIEAGAPEEITFRLSVGGTPLDPVCDFVASTEVFADTEPVHTATVSFSQDADSFEVCGLADLEVEAVTASSSSIDGPDLTLNLDQESVLDAGSFGQALRRAAIVALLIVWAAAASATLRDSSARHGAVPILEFLSAVVLAACGPLRPRWLRFRVEVASLKWDFKTSWLTNFTAIGAVLASLLAATDVLDQISLSNDQKAVYLFINVGALALTAAAPLAYAAFRSYHATDETTDRIPVQVTVRAEPGSDDDERQLLIFVPDVFVGDTDDEPDIVYPDISDDGLATYRKNVDAAFRASFEIPVRAVHPDGTETRHDASESCVAIEIPARGLHQPQALMTFVVTIPRWTAVFEQDADTSDHSVSTWAKATTATTTSAPSGTYFGLLLAGLIAAVGVGAQLSATNQLIQNGSFSNETSGVASAVLLGIAAVAAIFVMRSLSTRPRTIEHARRSVPATSDHKPVESLDNSRCPALTMPVAGLARLSPYAAGQQAPTLPEPPQPYEYIDPLTTHDGSPGIFVFPDTATAAPHPEGGAIFIGARPHDRPTITMGEEYGHLF